MKIHSALLISGCLLITTGGAFCAEIPNGGSVSGAISVNGEIDSHTFHGEAGQQGVISVSGNVIGGEYIRVFNPNSTALVNTDSFTLVTLSQTGSYTVEVSSFQATGTGNYQVHLALAPGANEHGLIPNGGSVAQSISDHGEIDSFTFEGVAGQQGVISVSGNVSTGEFYRVFNPSGTQLVTGSSQIFLTLPQTGTYTVVTSSFQANGTGDYVMHLALAPGANEHGLIPNGGSVAQSISDHGEIDSFTFEGIAGQQGMISITGSVSSGQFMRIFNPNGSQLQSSSGQLALTLIQSGTHTVIAQSFQASGTGAYSISLALNALPLPSVLLFPSEIDFDDVALGTSRTRILVMENKGAGTLRPGALVLSGQNAADFSVQMNTCASAQLAIDEFCVIEVRFAPTSPGVRQAALQLTSNAPSSPDIVPLRGAGGSLLVDGFEDR